MKLIPIIMSLLGLTSCSEGFTNVNVEEFAGLIAKEGVQLLDVRTPEEYAEGHIARSAMIDFKSETFEADAIAALDKTKPVAIYCRSGRRSAEAAGILARNGFKDISNLATGILGWTEAGMPVTTKSFSRPLILYYSQCGSTAAIAEEIRKQTGADIIRFDVTDPYTGTFEETIARCLKERADGITPTVNPIPDISGYDLIYFGYPVWFGTISPPAKSLLSSVCLDGKTIVPFCTFGSGGLTASSSDLKAALPGSTVEKGFGARAARALASAEDLNRFLIENGYKAGGIKPLPAYSEQAPVTPEQAAIFDEACGDYQFPLGTPITAGSRPADGGTDYLFTAESFGPDGQKATVNIYVSTREGQKAWFSIVDR